MANEKKKLPGNVEGNFFVDSTCINCDACRQLAPKTFEEHDEYSAVYHQPSSRSEGLAAYQALLACPAGSIGAIQTDRTLWDQAIKSFPLWLDEDVYYTGYNSPASFGANSYFVQHPDGNWLIDSPRCTKPLIEAFKRMGGLRYIFLTHEDDVADSGRYAKQFGAARIIHRADLAAVPDAEWVVDGQTIINVSDDFRIIPVPGHTPGSMALVFRNRYLFTGDHMWWDPESQCLDLPSVYVWNHQLLEQSTATLVNIPFEWILPGHGDRVHLHPDTMQQELLRLTERCFLR